MICKFLRRGRAHQKRAAEVDAQRERVEQQWPEVRESTRWSKTVRQQNHLSELFYQGITGGAHRD